jgi:hypothetical protein
MERVAAETLKEIADAEIDDGEEQARPKTHKEIEDAYSNLSFRVVYQSNNFLLPQIRDLINGHEVLNVRPEYQRRLRWTRKQRSLLIESLLLNIPIPPVFLYESEFARYEVMDGQQRLNAVHEFLENNFALIGLEKLSFLNGLSYKALPPRLQRGLERASVSAIVLLQETRGDENDPYLVRRYVFERLNTGGQPLNPQEMRNSIYRGSFNDLVVKLARHRTFCRLFGIPEYTETDENEYYENPSRQKNRLYRTMGDCQIVARFFALLNDEHISGAMRTILDNCYKRNRQAGSNEIAQYEASFVSVLDACDKLFPGEAFLLPQDDKGNRRISIALYDAITVALYKQVNQLDSLITKADQVRSSVNNLLATKLDLLTGRANTAQSIRGRIAAIESILRAVQ